MEKLSVILGENKAFLKVGEKELEIRPLTLNDISKAEEYFGCDLEGFEKALKRMKNLVFMISLALSKSNPEMTAEKVGELFGIGDMAKLQEVIQTILNISGLVQKND